MSATEVRVIATPAIAAGFALAGLDARTASSRRDGIALLVRTANDPAVAVVLVERELLNAMLAADRQELLRRPTPIIVPFEGPVWRAEPEREMDVILEILRRAIGYRVRLQ